MVRGSRRNVSASSKRPGLRSSLHGETVLAGGNHVVVAGARQGHRIVLLQGAAKPLSVPRPWR